MQTLLDTARRVLDASRNLLQGEPLRAIGYGAAVVIFLVSNASGRFADVSFDTAITLATTAVATLIGIIETARRYVYSPATVATIVTTPPAASGPIDAAIEAGVSEEQIVDAASLPDLDLGDD